MKKMLIGLAIALGVAQTVFAEKPVQVAFVDTGNTGRSISAEVLAESMIQRGHQHIAVISRGVDVNSFDVHPEKNAQTLLKERGIDVSAHIATQLVSNDVRHADVILTMTQKHKDKVIAMFPDAAAKTHTLSEFALGHYEEVADAWGKEMPVYQTVFKQLDTMLPLALEKVTQLKLTK